MLDHYRGAWQPISEAAGVSYSWLSKYMLGKIANPGYVTLTRLHAYLSSDAAAVQATQAAERRAERAAERRVELAAQAAERRANAIAKRAAAAEARASKRNGAPARKRRRKPKAVPPAVDVPVTFAA